jgi:hypothetical protein
VWLLAARSTAAVVLLVTAAHLQLFLTVQRVFQQAESHLCQHLWQVLLRLAQQVHGRFAVVTKVVWSQQA